jgi:hypothetical protein
MLRLTVDHPGQNLKLADGQRHPCGHDPDGERGAAIRGGAEADGHSAPQPRIVVPQECLCSVPAWRMAANLEFEPLRRLDRDARGVGSGRSDALPGPVWANGEDAG